jgi:hypothetical protein
MQDPICPDRIAHIMIDDVRPGSWRDQGATLEGGELATPGAAM